MLHMLTDELAEGVAEYVASCQTDEGGLAGEPGLEAHGGYTYCGKLKVHIYLNVCPRVHVVCLCMRSTNVEGLLVISMRIHVHT